MTNEVSKRFLESLQVASPCQADWDEMTGDEQVRFCQHCEKNVYNISEMTRGEAEAFMRKQEGPVCIRMYKRYDGTVINDNCPVGLRRVRQSLKAARARLWKVAAASFALLSSLFVCSSAQGENKSVQGEKKSNDTQKSGKSGAGETTASKDGNANKPNPKITAPMPLMGAIAPGPSPAMITTEASFKEQVAAIVGPKLKGKSLTQGTLLFHVNQLGEVDQCRLSQSTGDKELDAALVAAVKGKKLAVPTGAEMTWRWVAVCLSECLPDAKAKPGEAK